VAWNRAGAYDHGGAAQQAVADGLPVSYRIDLIDNGEPGQQDTYQIRLSNGYDFVAAGNRNRLIALPAMARKATINTMSGQRRGPYHRVARRSDHERAGCSAAASLSRTVESSAALRARAAPNAASMT
jgi:hypothetical protein